MVNETAYVKVLKLSTSCLQMENNRHGRAKWLEVDFRTLWNVLGSYPWGAGVRCEYLLALPVLPVQASPEEVRVMQLIKLSESIEEGPFLALCCPLQYGSWHCTRWVHSQPEAPGRPKPYCPLGASVSPSHHSDPQLQPELLSLQASDPQALRKLLSSFFSLHTSFSHFLGC